MLELLGQLHGFHSRGDVKLILATNRIESLDLALLRPGRIDRKIEFPHPDIKTMRCIFLCNALMAMYAKCGCIDPALQLFNQMLKRHVISRSTMIGGLANHGKAREAIELLQDMQRAGIEPNGITFLGLLSALRYFDSMKKDYQLEPEIEHYGCLVDLLGRAGRLDHALEAVKKMPMKPDAKIWGSLLNSCRTHCKVEIAIVAME